MPANAAPKLALAAVMLTAAACVSSELATNSRDPANARAAGAPPSPASSALRQGFEPFEAYGIDGPAQGSGDEHAGHQEHAAAETTPEAQGAPEPPHAGHDHGSASDGGATPQPKGAVVYVCPMHPQIRRQAPGRCPICGMKLEPQKAGPR